MYINIQNYSWPCIHRWMTARSGRMTCPVCKADINEEKLIPVYGRNTTDPQDPRKKIPPRPQGQRQETDNTNVSKILQDIECTKNSKGVKLIKYIAYQPFR